MVDVIKRFQVSGVSQAAGYKTVSLIKKETLKANPPKTDKYRISNHKCSAGGSEGGILSAGGLFCGSLFKPREVSYKVSARVPV
jgi:hypothetical protein